MPPEESRSPNTRLHHTYGCAIQHVVKLIAHLKLQPTPEQADALLRTLETANAACTSISHMAWNMQTFGKFDIQKVCYDHIRSTFPLSAQVVIRCIGKVADAYKLYKGGRRAFKPHGAVPYDDRILSWNMHEPSVSIWTINGRQSIPFVCGKRQWELLQTRHGETDLVYIKGQFYLLAVCAVEEPTPDDVEGVLSVDLGITNIATDSDGETHFGADVDRVRARYHLRRKRLQSVGTKNSRRRLRQLSGRQAKFQKDTNHRIAKQLVAKAQHTKRTIALEDLKGIRERARVRGKQQRARHANWSFGQLRTFIDYKARLAGVTVVLVDPAYTSQACNRCGCVDKRNRPTQSTFCCVSCFHKAPADYNASLNIRDRAAVIQPMASNRRVQVQAADL